MHKKYELLLIRKNTPKEKAA